MKIDIQIDDRKFKAHQKKMIQYIDFYLATDVYDFFKYATPIRSGNARSETYLTSRDDVVTIEARYPYAKRLDNGWSRQAPNGMTKPTERYLKKRLDKVMRKR